MPKKRGRGALPGDQHRLGRVFPHKTCVNCGETKLATRFPKRGGLTYEKLVPTDVKRYDSQCKLCKKNALPGQDRSELKEPRRRPGKKKKAKKPEWNESEYRKRVRAETRVKSMQYLAMKGCEECDERDPRALEYDHKDPSDKGRNVSRLITEGYSWSSDKLRAEIRKCRVLCASCHRRHTIAQQGYYQDPIVAQVIKELAAEHGFDV